MKKLLLLLVLLLASCSTDPIEQPITNQPQPEAPVSNTVTYNIKVDVTTGLNSLYECKIYRNGVLLSNTTEASFTYTKQPGQQLAPWAITVKISHSQNIIGVIRVNDNAQLYFNWLPSFHEYTFNLPY